MLTILNRRELLVTLSIERQAEVRRMSSSCSAIWIFS